MSDLGNNIDSDLNLEVPPNEVLAPKKDAKKATSVGMPETVRIILEENDDIPPTGLFLGVNGKGYLIRPGEVVNVPKSVVDVLDHAVMSSPQLDPATKQVMGYRERMRYPYRFA